jgi:hypothetical protein
MSHDSRLKELRGHCCMHRMRTDTYHQNTRTHVRLYVMAAARERPPPSAGTWHGLRGGAGESEVEERHKWAGCGATPTLAILPTGRARPRQATAAALTEQALRPGITLPRGLLPPQPFASSHNAVETQNHEPPDDEQLLGPRIRPKLPYYRRRMDKPPRQLRFGRCRSATT